MDGGAQTPRPDAGRRARPRDWWPYAAAGVVLLLAGIAVLRLAAWGAGAPGAPAPATDDWFDPAALAADRPFRRGLWALAAAGALAVPAAVLLAARFGGRWRPRVVRLARARPWRAGLIAGAGLACLVQAALLPVAAARFAWARAHGVIVQPVDGWLVDRLLALAIHAAVLCAVGALAAVLIARLARWWWLALAGAVSVLTIALVAVSPVVVAPLFERTEPVRDPALRAELLDLADRAGVDAGEVRVSDASSRTTAANARVAGLGAGRRIVLHDTLLRDFPPEQVRVVVAHELAHVAARHVAKGTAWVVVLSAPVLLLLFALVGGRTGFQPTGKGQDGCDLVVRRLTVLAAGAAVVALLSLPLQNAVSRSFEREADRDALALTGDPRAAVELQRGLVARSRNVPDPPSAVVWWFGTHPTALERMGRALAWGAGT